MHLLKRIDVLEKRVGENSNYIRRQKDKIDVVEYLEMRDESVEECVSYNEFINKIAVTDKSLRKFLKNDEISKGYVSILYKNIKSLFGTDPNKFPIKSFSSKNNIIYVRVKREMGGYFWLKIKDDAFFEKTIFIIQLRLLKLYEAKYVSVECKKAERYFAEKKKILATKQSKISKLFRVKLYEKLKADLDYVCK